MFLSILQVRRPFYNTVRLHFFAPALIALLLLSNNTSAQDIACLSIKNKPIYYTINTVYAYQEKSTNSAIVVEIPAKSSVRVTNSFWGDTGWWEVCYKGQSGWVKKSSLTFRRETTNDEIFRDNRHVDIPQKTVVKFNPFIGQTTSNVNFRANPSASSSNIMTLERGTMLYVFSNESINGFYKVINVDNSKIGWVSKSYIKYIEDADVSESGAFQSTGYVASDNSEVTVRNKSSYSITLIVENQTFLLKPLTTKKITIDPGRKYYIASAPGVIPASGYQVFKSNNGYEWEFWVATSYK